MWGTGFVRNAKVRACVHCRRASTLNVHGVLTGYCEVGEERERRGIRLFCSNRHRRPGCGRTHSVYLASVVCRLRPSTRTLWKVARALAEGVSVREAWQKHATMALPTGYRIVRRLLAHQSALRVRLCVTGPPPKSESAHPLAQLLAHIKSAFPEAECPFAAYQLHFQEGIL